MSWKKIKCEWSSLKPHQFMLQAKRSNENPNSEREINKFKRRGIAFISNKIFTIKFHLQTTLTWKCFILQVVSSRCQSQVTLVKVPL